MTLTTKKRLAAGVAGLFLMTAAEAFQEAQAGAVGSSTSRAPGSQPAAAAAPETPAGRAREFDATAWRALLRTYVRDGRVDYASWKRDGSKELDALLTAMSKHPYRTVFAKEARVGFLINAYNAFGVQQVLKAYPLASVRDIPGFFDKATLALDGGTFTLDQIEKELIAPIASQEPRYHLALSRCAVGGPALYPTPIMGDSLALQLERMTLDFLRNRSANRFRSQEPDTLFLSEFFQWHRREFESGEQTLVRRLAPNFGLGDMMRMMQEEPPIAWVPFDWRLNDSALAGSGQ